MQYKLFLTVIAWVGMALLGGLQVSAKTKAGLADMTRRAAAEGIVLLKNENEVLPLTPDRTVSVFGRIQVDYFACGYGSGGDVKTPYIINIVDAMRRHPSLRINEALADIYQHWCRQNPPGNGSWGNWPLNHPEMPLDDAVVAAAAAVSDTAVVVIGRSAGEDRETKLEKGSYYLTDEEEQMLARVSGHFEHIVVLLNSGNIIDMSWMGQYEHLDAVLYIWQGGMQGGVAVADVLSGDVSPSGKLTATIAKQYSDYPTSGKSGGEKVFGGWNFSNYVEDIFVGYRYFETFAEDAVLYPFGYGLSYTDFEVETCKVDESNGRLTVDVTVKNTGSTYAGKEVVQVYYGAPQGALGKAVKSLAAYAKTRTLAPGESENIQLSFKVDNMASYDDSGKTGHKSAYVLEAGEYPVYVGNSVRTAVKAGAHTESRLRVIRQMTEVSAVPGKSRFKRLRVARDRHGKITPVYEDVPTRTVPLASVIQNNLPKDIRQTGDRDIKLLDVFSGKADMKMFVAQLSVDELEALCRGDHNMGSSLGAPGNASVFGGVSPSLRDKGVVPVTTVDGPSGIRLTASASLLPIGTTLACSWNDRMVEELYALVGREMLLNQADVLLAPGMNIQRDPLCGRNFEYFSEDPLLTGQMGAGVVRGLQSQGVSATPKHFGLNNQETRRNVHDSRCSERAIREIYMKAFEIVVKTAAPQNIMASYNKINGVYSHYHYDLFTMLLRAEWGYDGVVMTDWWIKPGECPDNATIYDNAYRVQAQVDVLMPGEGPGDGAKDRSLLTSYESGKGIALGEMQRSAANTLRHVMRSPAFREANGLDLYAYTAGEHCFSVQQKVVDAPRLTSLSLEGKPLQAFNPLVLDYEVYVPEGAEIPQWNAVASPAGQLEISPATASSPVATIKVSNDGAHMSYRIFFTDRAGLEPLVENPVYAKVSGLYVNGEELRQFYPKELEYNVVVPDLTDVRITADAPAGVTIKVIKKQVGDVVVVRAESPHQAMEYQLYLTTEAGEGMPVLKRIEIGDQGATKLQAEDFMYKTSAINTQPCEDDEGGLNLGWTTSGSYLLYAIHVKKSGTYSLSPRVASNVSAITQLSYNIEVNGDVVASYIHGGTGGWQSWQSMEPKQIYLEKGDHKLRLHFITSDVNLNYLDFTPDNVNSSVSSVF